MAENKTTWLYWTEDTSKPIYEDIPQEAWNNYESLKAFLLQCLGKDKQAMISNLKKVQKLNQEQTNERIFVISNAQTDAIFCNQAIRLFDEMDRQKDNVKSLFIADLLEYAQYKHVEYLDINYYLLSILHGVADGKKLYNKDISEARANIYMPASQNLHRICTNFKKEWSKADYVEEFQNLEAITLTDNKPALFGIIIASAINGYYKAYNKKDERTSFTAYKIAEIMQGKAPQKNKTELYEECILGLELFGKLPIEMQAYGNVKPQDAHVTSAWAFVSDPYKPMRSTTYNKCDNMLKDLIPGTTFIKLDAELMHAELLQQCKTVQRTCIYYYLALIITEARAQGQETTQVNLAELYNIIEVEPEKFSNKSYSLNSTIMPIMNKWKEKGIIKHAEPSGIRNKNEYININL